MEKKCKVVAIVAAAGQGRRMNKGINKQYICLREKPILVHTLEVFERIQEIGEVVLVVHPQEIQYCNQEIVRSYGLQKVKKVVAGGKERQESIQRGLEAIDSDCEIVVIHDGARPFVTEEIILKSIEEAQKHRAVGVGVPVKDTIKVVEEEGWIKDTPDRKQLWAMHTPQTFAFEVILNAHRCAVTEGFVATDDTMLVERLGIPVKMLYGSYENIKMTTPEDLYIGEAILQSRKAHGQKE